jgi:two-component system sensor histidine kinase AlgZ
MIVAMSRAKQRTLSAEFIWLIAVGPTICSVLVDRTFLAASWRQMGVRLAANSIAFLSMPLAFALLYRFALSRWLERMKSKWQRAALQFVAITGTAVAVSQAVFPLHWRLLAHPENRRNFALTCLVIAWLFMFPTLLIQSLRQRARALEVAAMAERQVALEAQLVALQARTNPHFFFNSVNTVASLIPEDPELAERTLERLAELFRYALDSARTRLVPLSREFEMVRDYLAIETARFGARLRTEVSLDPAAATVAVPPLLLQPLVENAILHGIGRRQGGAVAVVASRNRDQVIIEVTDDGPGAGGSSHAGTGSSFRELGERIRLIYGERAVLALGPSASGGCLARLELPAEAA